MKWRQLLQEAGLASAAATARFSLVHFSAAIVCTLGALWGNQSPARAQSAQKSPPALASEVEEIYIARSVRESRVAATEFCATAKTGVSDPTNEDQHTFRSVAIRTTDGRVTDTDIKTIGSIHSCLGSTSNPAILQFFGDLLFEHLAFKGLGECHLRKA